MATTTVPSQLSRAVRRGTMPTRTMPPKEHAMTTTAAPQSESPMDELAALLKTPSDDPAPDAVALPEVCRVDVAAAAPAPESKGAASTPVRFGGRSARFGGAAGDPLAEKKSVAAPAPAASERPWSRFVAEEDRTSVIQARQAMAAAKVLAPLVAAVSFRPGSAGTHVARAAALKDMLLQVHRGATDTAMAWSQRAGRDVPAWCVSQLMQGFADIIARRWERTGAVDVETMVVMLNGILADPSEDAVQLVLEASDQAYVEVTTREIAADRVAVSTAAAGWVLYDWVTHEQLSLDPKGCTPSRFYSYDQEPAEVVTKMLRAAVGFCRSVNLNVAEAADLRVSHLQASIRRMASLMGAEYVCQTRLVMDWLADDGISDEEFRQRKAVAAAELDSRILPHVFEWARRNFLRIEEGAMGAMENLNEPQNLRRGDSGDAARPANG